MADSNSASDVASIISDIAPLSQLIGEKSVKAFISHVSNPWEYGLLAFAPLGVVTVLTSIVRLNDFKLANVAIGRGSENLSDVRKELLLCSPNHDEMQTLDDIGQASLSVDQNMSHPGILTRVNKMDIANLPRRDWEVLPMLAKGMSFGDGADSEFSGILCGRTKNVVSWTTVRAKPLGFIRSMNALLLACMGVITWWRYSLGEAIYGLVGYWLQACGVWLSLLLIDRTTYNDCECYLDVPACGMFVTLDGEVKNAFIGNTGRHVISEFTRPIPVWQMIPVALMLNVGFVLNYLGLRLISWYVAFTIAILSIAATLIRAYVLAPTSNAVKTATRMDVRFKNEFIDNAFQCLDKDVMIQRDNKFLFRYSCGKLETQFFRFCYFMEYLNAGTFEAIYRDFLRLEAKQTYLVFIRNTVTMPDKIIVIQLNDNVLSAVFKPMAEKDTPVPRIFIFDRCNMSTVWDNEGAVDQEKWIATMNKYGMTTQEIAIHIDDVSSKKQSLRPITSDFVQEPDASLRPGNGRLVQEATIALSGQQPLPAGSNDRKTLDPDISIL